MEEFAKSQDSNIGSSFTFASPTVQDPTESASSLSSGCSNDPTLSGSTMSLPVSDDPFLRPILCELSHPSSLPIDRTCKWKHILENNNSLNLTQENSHFPTSKPLSHKDNDGRNLLIDEDDPFTISCLTSPDNGSLCQSNSERSSLCYTPPRFNSSSQDGGMMTSNLTCEHSFSAESCSAGNNSPAAMLDCDSTEFGNVDSSVLLALSHPATHISDLSSPLYFTPIRYKTPYPSGVPLSIPLQDMESKQNLDIMTEQMVHNFSQSNDPYQDILFRADDIHNVVVHHAGRDACLEESADLRSSFSTDVLYLSLRQQVERSTEDSDSLTESYDSLPSVSELKVPMYIALRNHRVSTTEWPVRFALARSRHCPVAIAFHQWKMLIHLKVWRQKKMSHADKMSNKLRLKQYFR